MTAAQSVDLPIPRPRDAEVGLDFDRQWLEFTDPGDEEHVVRADLTWLLSRWNCLFGNGCHGITEGRADAGCCTHGAFFTDADDEKLVRNAVKRLTKHTWQRKVRGFENYTEWDDIDGEDARRTRIVDGACIFHNDAGFEGGYGCALHQLALREGRPITQTKPEVCWHVPIRRVQEWETRTDDTQILVDTVTEFSRRSWGEGGHDLNWWCSGAPEAHTGAEPVYLSYATELRALIGDTGYDRLVELCRQAESGGVFAEHPATTEARRQGLLPSSSQTATATATAKQKKPATKSTKQRG